MPWWCGIDAAIPTPTRRQRALQPARSEPSTAGDQLSTLETASSQTATTSFSASQWSPHRLDPWLLPRSTSGGRVKTLGIRPARSELVCRVSVEDSREHRCQPCEVGFGSRSVACAVQLGQVGLLPVEAGAAF